MRRKEGQEEQNDEEALIGYLNSQNDTVDPLNSQ